jgi:hypothetical protein
MIADVGDICHFLPKFHPEMNPIKYLWGWAKQYFHEHSNGNFKMAQKLWQEALNSCLLLTIHRFFHCAALYMSVYKLGATGVVAEYVIKKYHSQCHIMLFNKRSWRPLRQSGIGRQSPWPQPHLSRLFGDDLMTIWWFYLG